jgi:hypothetical protein
MTYGAVRVDPHPCSAGTHWRRTEQRGLLKLVELIAVQLAADQA